MRRVVKVTEPNAGRRLDAFVRRELEDVPLAAVMKWLRTGVVRVNGKKAKPAQRLATGDEITMPDTSQPPPSRPAEPETSHRSTSSALTTPPAHSSQPGHSAPSVQSERSVQSARSVQSERSSRSVQSVQSERSSPPSVTSANSPRPARSAAGPRARSPRVTFTVIYEDEHILVVDKPALLAAHAGTGQSDSLADQVARYLNAENAPTGHKPGLAQRLDRGVSGLVPIGKDAKALRIMAEHVARDRVRKIYRAIVIGTVAKAEGDITVPLRIDDQPMGNRPRVHPDPNGLPAHTRYSRIEVMPRASVLDVEIHTGRTHQIRAHLRHLGHPLIGDPRYGNPRRDLDAVGIHRDVIPQRPALHARQLIFEHPITSATLTLDAPLPSDLTDLCEALRARPR